MTNNKDNFFERWEQGFLLLILFSFIILGVLFFVFVIPKINPNFSYNERNTKNDFAVSIEENDPAKNFSMGMRSSSSMNYSEALLYFQKAVERDPKNVDYLSELALTHYRLKNYDEAIKIYGVLMELDKDNYASYSNSTANIYWIKKEYEVAESYFEKSINMSPESSIGYNNLALMLDEQGKKEEAISVLKRGIENSNNREELEDTFFIIEGQDNS